MIISHDMNEAILPRLLTASVTRVARTMPVGPALTT